MLPASNLADAESKVKLSCLTHLYNPCQISQLQCKQCLCQSNAHPLDMKQKTSGSQTRHPLLQMWCDLWKPRNKPTTVTRAYCGQAHHVPTLLCTICSDATSSSFQECFLCEQQPCETRLFLYPIPPEIINPL